MRDKPAHQSEVCFCRCSTAEGIKVIREKPGDLELRHSVTHARQVNGNTQSVFTVAAAARSMDLTDVSATEVQK